MASIDNGVIRGKITPGARGYTVLVFLCVALYNTIELTFIIWGYFRRHSGMYFWSFNIATYGIVVYSLGWLFKATLSERGTWVYVTMVAVGWVAMILGQSLVLWSRLHLVLRDDFKLRLILWLIIINSVCMFCPTLVMLYGANSNSPGRWLPIYSIYENIQVSMFSAQEFILSLIYIGETIKLAKLHTELRHAWRSRRLMIQLVVVNVTIILLDLIILILEYTRNYGVQTAFKGFVYSVKLKMEFTILNRLKEMTTGRKSSSSDPTNSTEEPSNTTPARRASTATGTDISSPTAANSHQYYPNMPRRPPPISYHAYVHGGTSSYSEYDRRRDGGAESSSLDNSVVMTTEIHVKRETMPPGFQGDVEDALAGDTGAASGNRGPASVGSSYGHRSIWSQGRRSSGSSLELNEMA